MIPNRAILHCSDTPDDPKSRWYDTRPETIREWHLERGFLDTAYHFIITRDGEIHTGRKDTKQGAHTRGQNTRSLGICWVGRFIPTEAQRESIHWLFFELNEKWGIEADDWYGHYELAIDPTTGKSTKTCPNLPMDYLRDKLRKI